MRSDTGEHPVNQLFGEQFAFETLGAASIEDHCVTLRGELQGLRTTIESRRQRRASLSGSLSRRPSHSLQDAAQLQQEVRAEVIQDFEKRLADMHVQLLAKEHEFEEYRQQMEHDLKLELRAAQSHLVSQLVDKSGVMSVENKTHFLESLHGQVELERLQKENLAFKQTLLKLQTIHGMQHQIRTVENEKEQALQKAQRQRSVQLVNENAQLQQRIRQLETEVSNISQERTFFQSKYTELIKQNELAAQRRREAKVRALSASYRRRLDGIEEPENEVRSKNSFEFEQREEAFEKIHEVRIRSPRRAEAAAPKSVADVKREGHHLENATRHYQNEIKRLQQQLSKEIKLKTQLLDQVTQLKADAQEGNNSGDEDGSAIPAQCGASNHKLARGTTSSASPRVRAASASVCSPYRKVQVVLMPPRRPSTSSSTRVQRPPHGASASPRVAPSTSTNQCQEIHTPPAEHASAAPSASIPPRSWSASASPNRKFEVHTREPPVVKVGGVAGVHNVLSPRERLPYR